MAIGMRQWAIGKAVHSMLVDDEELDMMIL
jgi:hypothetical protein